MPSSLTCRTWLVLAGWSSGSKYPLLGAVRSTQPLTAVLADAQVSGPDARTVAIVLPQPGTVPYLTLGGGAVLDAGPVRLDLHFRDAISEYWDRQQHDVMVALGAAWRLPPTSR